MIISAKRLPGDVLRLATALAVVCSLALADNPTALVLPVTAVFALCASLYRFDFTNLWVAFALPWLLILGFSTLDISSYSRPVSRETLLAVASVLSMGLVLLPAWSKPRIRHDMAIGRVDEVRFKVLLGFYLAFCALNVALAGYVPLIQSITTGDSGYMDFGVKGIYGVFNAFSNAFGLTAYYLWLTQGRRRLYLASFLTVLGIFFLFVTRQNMISLLVEAFIVYCAVVKRVSGVRMLLLCCVTLFAFALIGDLRVGVDIAELAGIRDQYAWLPKALIWLYTYCYFNILNLDNVIAISTPPAFNGSSLASLLPSFLRPELNGTDQTLENTSFTVDSFISPLIHDVGLAGTLVAFALLCLAGRWYSNQRRHGDPFTSTLGFSVFYFCFLFSFFVNFWFYLPVIFQISFFPLFRKFIFRSKGRPT